MKRIDIEETAVEHAGLARTNGKLRGFSARSIRIPAALAFAALWLAAIPAISAALQSKPAAQQAHPSYEFFQNHDPDGIGKFYMGREIAQVMGHQAADWLDRPEREAEEAPSILIKALKLKPGMTVADIGAGS